MIYIRWFLVLLMLIFILGCSTQENVSQDSGAADQPEVLDAQPSVNVEPEPAKPEETCSDGIKNQDETDIDCGGICDPCPTCSDGIKNQDETDIDCGGICDPCKPEIPEPISYSITDDQEKAMLEKLTETTPSDFLTSSYPAGLRVGESYVFVYGITNTGLEHDNESFRFSIKFRKARNAKNNPIEVDEDTILSWFDDNEFPKPTLERYEEFALPVGLTVGDEIGPDRPTVPGTYYFEMIVEMDRGYRYVDYSSDEFNIRVK